MDPNLFFQLIQVAIGRRESLSEIPSAGVWSSLLDMAVKQGLVGICGSAIERLPDGQRPPRVVALKWAFLVNKIELRNKWLNVKCCELTELLDSDGFCSSILKGQGIATLYPEPLRRQSGDIDILVRIKDAAADSCCMDEIVEYVRRHSEEPEIVYHHAGLRAAFRRMPDGRVAYVDSCDEDDIEVEMHYRPSWFYSPLRNHRFQKWAMAQAYPGCLCKSSDGVFFMPDIEYNAVYILVHIYRHLFDEGIGLRQLLDYYYVLMHLCYDCRIDAVTRTLSQLGMTRFCRAVMFVLHHVFGLDERHMILRPDEKEGRFLLEEIMTAGNFGHYDERSKPRPNESLIARFVRRQKRVARFLLHYPEETVCAPFWTMWQWTWRHCKGYL